MILQIMLDHILIDPDQPTPGAVIFLHGLGADGHDFEPIVPELKIDDLNLRFIFPHAPERAITINNGETMRAWYDFVPHSETSGAEDIKASAQLIQALIQDQMDQGIAPNKIILAGFSQGGVMALEVGLRQPTRIAGVVGLSTYLHDANATERERTDANLGIPIFLGHGRMDPMIPIMRAATSRENLVRMAYDVEWHDYSMGHQVCMEEIEDLAQFIRRCL